VSSVARCASNRPFRQGALRALLYIADVGGKTLGRAATKIASVLRGKNKAMFTPHADAGDFCRLDQRREGSPDRQEVGR